MRRVQVVFPGALVPESVEVPGALRSQRLGPVLTAIARVADDSQLDGLRAAAGVRVNVYPLTLEELFVEWFEPPPLVGARTSNPENLGRSGDPVGGNP